jgi:hypothetical protein
VGASPQWLPLLPPRILLLWSTGSGRDTRQPSLHRTKPLLDTRAVTRHGCASSGLWRRVGSLGRGRRPAELALSSACGRSLPLARGDFRSGGTVLTPLSSCPCVGMRCRGSLCTPASWRTPRSRCSSSTRRPCCATSSSCGLRTCCLALGSTGLVCSHLSRSQPPSPRCSYRTSELCGGGRRTDLCGPGPLPRTLCLLAPAQVGAVWSRAWGGGGTGVGPALRGSGLLQINGATCGVARRWNPDSLRHPLRDTLWGLWQ